LREQILSDHEQGVRPRSDFGESIDSRKFETTVLVRLKESIVRRPFDAITLHFCGAWYSPFDRINEVGQLAGPVILDGVITEVVLDRAQAHREQSGSGGA
jgi:hypothetical protein